MLKFVKKDPVLVTSGILAIVSCFFVRPDQEYAGYIDWRVLGILFSMMLVVAELVRIGLFKKLTDMLLEKVHTSRAVSLILVWLCFFMGMILTNDVTLVTMVPFAIGVMNSFDDRKSTTYTLILMTVAANLGSMQTPIGNPQNLYLYTKYAVPLGDFLKLMLPYSLLSLALVTAAVFILCKKTVSGKREKEQNKSLDRPRLIISLLLFALCLLVVARVIEYWIVLLVLIAVMIFMDRKAFHYVDFTLLITFVFFFVFVGNMGRIDAVREVISNVVETEPVLTAALSSQVISNVPAALLLSAFTRNGQALIIGTNLGGLGTLIASMASLITYKFHSAMPKPEDKKTPGYIPAFTVINIIFLLILFGLYLLLSKL
ncbi:MAG: citrate transporter [Clostridiales bacterium]|nr:citrate transporter [Clostridiales bacterium]